MRPRLLAPDSPSPAALDNELVSASRPIVARSRIDAARYAAAPIDPRDRARPIWLATVATLTLAMAGLARRRAATLVAAVAIAWSIALIVVLARRPAFDRIADGNVDWLIARRAATASVPMTDDAAWVPVVESMRHWRALAPRVAVDADGHATLQLTLGAAGARVAIERPSR